LRTARDKLSKNLEGKDTLSPEFMERFERMKQSLDEALAVQERIETHLYVDLSHVLVVGRDLLTAFCRDDIAKGRV
jgi:hypothetical protein